MVVVGDRVEVGQERCTIRWEGVVGDTGEWLGVEWDREGRGKHDGEHNNIRYFTPVRNGNNCSFLRRGKVTQLGIGLVEAVKDRYGVVEGKTAGVEQDKIMDLQAEIGARFVEVVGFDKVNKEQSQTRGLKTVSVRNMGVMGRGELQNVGAELPKLRDLDLSESLVSNWTEVSMLCNQLKLHTLDLSYNLLPIETIDNTVKNMDTLKHLVVGHMLYSGYTWSDIVHLAIHLPCLSVLQIHNNSISSLSSFDPSLFSALVELDLDGNNLTSWTDVEHLSELPQLTHLRLNGNQLTEIAPARGSFKQLRSLQLSGNCIKTWDSVGMLDRLQLAELRMRSNPVNNTCKDEETARQLIIARVSSLTALNGTQITQTERKWAEIDYLKTYGQLWLGLAKLEDTVTREQATKEFLDKHNRYDKIVEMHGEPEAGDGVKVDTTLKASLVKLKVRSPDVIGSAETVKKVPTSMSVAKLRALLHRIYRDQAGGSRLKISLVSSANKEQEVQMDNDMREVSFYSVSEGDTLLVRWGQPSIKQTTVTDL